MKRLVLTLLGLSVFVFTPKIYGQAGSYTFSVSTATYAPLGPGATQVPDISDDYVNDTVPIGFTFYFEGIGYDSVSATSDGFLSFMKGASSVTTNNLSGVSSSKRPLVAPLWDDLDGTVGIASYELSGTAPNRVFTFEWKDWEWNWNADDSVVSFQVKLYETTNEIQFTYHWEKPSTINSPSASIGLSGDSTYLSVTGVGTANPMAFNASEDGDIDTVVTDQVFSFMPPTCSSPISDSIVVTAFDTATVYFSSTSTGPWYINYGPSGFTAGSASSNYDTATATQFGINGLMPETDYDYYIQSNCGANGNSTWSGPYSFTTPPSCPMPMALVDSNVTSSSIDLGWQSGGSGPWYIYWGPSGFNQASPSVHLDTVSTNYTTFSGLMAGTSYDFFIMEDCAANGISDTAGPLTVITPCITQSLPYMENFNGSLGCFTVLDSGTSADTWMQAADLDGDDLDGTGFALVNSDAAYFEDMDEYLVSPSIDAGSIGGSLILEFDQYYRSSSDSAVVDVWDGTQWVRVLTQGSTAGSFTSPDHELIDVTAYANANFKVRFHYFDAYYGWYWAVDNFSVKEVLCNASSFLGAYATASDSIAVNWQPGNGQSFGLEYALSGFTPGTGTYVSTTDTFAIAHGLTPNTSYDFYLTDTCATGYSTTLGPVTITTPCIKQAIPFLETFDTELGCFQVTKNGGSTPDTWQWTGKYDGNTLDADTGFAFVNSDAAGIGNTMDEILTSPTFDLSSVTGTPVLEFDQFYKHYSSSDDTADVDIWDGTQWVNVLQQTSDIGDWGNADHQLIDLSPYANANLKVRFHYYHATWAYYWAIDNFEVKTYSCGVASALDTGVVTAHTASLNWTSGGSNWNILWGPAGFDQASGTGTWIKNVTSNPYMLTGLGADSCFEYYVQDTCVGSGIGPLIGPFYFCTPPTCPAPTALGVVQASATSSGADVYWTTGGSSTWNIEYGLAGFVPGTGTMLTAYNDTTTIPGLMAATCYEFYVRDSCGPGDLSEWTGPFGFTTAAGQFSVPFHEGFESGFTYFGNNCENETMWATQSSLMNLGSYSAKLAYQNYDNSVLEMRGVVDLSNMAVPVLAFAQIAKLEGSYDEGHVQISTDGGATYTDLPDSAYLGNDANYASYEYFDEDAYSIWGTGNTVPAQNSWWKAERFDLSAYKTSNVRIRFMINSDGSSTREGWYLDDITIYDSTVTCDAPANVVATALNCDSVEVTWNSGSTATSSYIEYGMPGFMPGTGTVVANAGSPYYITGLSFNTDYDIYVGDSCSVDGSILAGPVAVKTDSLGPVMASFTYVQSDTTMADATVDFDASASSGSGLTYSWSFGNGDSATTMDPSATYTGNGNYTVTLTVTDRCGSTDDTTMTITVGGVSIIENRFDANVEIYPNPSEGQFKVNVTMGSNYNLVVSDLSGRIIYKENDLSIGASHVIDLGHVPAGVYLVHFSSKGLNVTQRIIVK